MNRTQWVVILDGTFWECDKAMVAAIAEHLRKILADPDLTIKQIGPGSIVLLVESSERTFQKMKSLVSAGDLPTVLGLTVRALRSTKVEVFVSYSHKDERKRDKLLDHFAPLLRAAEIDIWHDRRIAPGEKWNNEISEHLDSAQVIVPLVSASFLSSDYINGAEMKRARERYQAGEAVILPVILSPCDWKSTWLGELLCLPKDGRPIVDHRLQDNAWLQVAGAVRNAARKLTGPWKSQETEGWKNVESGLRETARKVRSEIKSLENRLQEAHAIMSTPRNHFSHGDLIPAFDTLLDALEQWIGELPVEGTTNRFKDSLDAVRRALKDPYLTVGVFGRVNAGKSTLVNALLGANISPRNVDAMTAVPVRVRYGTEKQALVSWSDGRRELKEILDLSEWMLELRQKTNTVATVVEVLSEIDQPILGQGGQIQILDTAGVGGWTDEETRKSFSLLEKAVAAILVYKHDDALSKEFLKMLTTLAERGGVLLFAVCNRDDQFKGYERRSLTELQKSMSGKVQELQRAGGRCFVVDILEGWEAKSKSDPLLLEKSGLATLESALRGQLRYKDAYFLRERITEATTLSDDMSSYCQKEVEALRSTVESIKKKIHRIKTDADRLIQMISAVTKLINKWEEQSASVGKAIGVGILGGLFGAAPGGIVAIAGATVAAPWIAIPAIALACLGAFAGGSPDLDRVRVLEEIKRELNHLKRYVGESRMVPEELQNRLSTPKSGQPEELQTLRKQLQTLNRQIAIRKNSQVEHEESRPENLALQKHIVLLTGQTLLRNDLKRLDARVGELLSE